jgi:hypothetical protein
LKMEDPLLNLNKLEIHAAKAEVVNWQGREALRLEDGLALIPEGRLKDASLEVLIGTDGPAYPGVAFRVIDILNYELAYAVPHVSGQWDALQYDPIFHGSNTWQIYHGSGYQGKAQVPTGRWFHLEVDYYEQIAMISVDGGLPLVVERLAHATTPGRFGVWTYRPAYFCDMRISSCEISEAPATEATGIAEGVVESWFVDDYGVVVCEPNGVINLNRYFPAAMKVARLIRRFEISEEGEFTFEFGFSDVLILELNDEMIFKGENTFTGFADRVARGYAALGTETVRQVLAPGSYHLVAELEVSEEFGWGLALAAYGEGLRWLPAESG